MFLLVTYYGPVTPKKSAQFSFAMVGLKKGDELRFSENPNISCTVEDEKHVRYGDRIYSLSGLAKELKGKGVAYQGPKFFTYKGELLTEMRRRLEE